MTFKEAMVGAIPVMAKREIRERYEIAVVDQRRGTKKLGKMVGCAFMVCDMPFAGFDDVQIWDWAHTDRTMLVIL